ncbi:MAG: alanyl-tRNA editing protein [Thermoplasmata archaeon]
MTELAYLPDLAAAYVRTFRARATALPPGAVVLDRTFFYPTGGGQPSDRGVLRTEGGGNLEVIDVVRSGPGVIHRIRADPEIARALRVGVELEGTLDWERRHRHMRLHTGQHLLSARVFARTGLRTRKANLAGSGATIDLEGPLAPDALESVMRDVRDAVDRPRPVTIRLVPRAEWDAHPFAGRSGLVPLPTQVDPVRVVEIDAADVCPCGGTHVRSTGEIGEVRALPMVPLPGGASRVAFTLVAGGLATPPE